MSDSDHVSIDEDESRNQVTFIRPVMGKVTYGSKGIRNQQAFSDLQDCNY
jgi:hypothetical protein